MAPRLVQLLWAGDGGQTFSISIDATTREVHSMANEVTSHAVEIGANLSDHIRPEADVLTIDGVISNAPHYLPADHVGNAVAVNQQITAELAATDSTGVVTGASPRLGRFVNLPGANLVPVGPPARASVGSRTEARTLSATVTAFSEEFDRVREIFEELASLRTLGTLLRVITSLNEYDNMAIQSLEATRQGGQYDNLTFSLTVKRVKFGETKEVAVPAIATKRKDKGTVTPEEDVDQREGETMLHYGFGKR